MTATILLASEPVDLSHLRRAFAVVAPGSPIPIGIEIVSLDDLLAERERWLGGDYETMAIVGLSRMMTPSNRVRLGQVLLRPRANLSRVSIDDKLFVSEPWRMWWHFYSVGCERWGYTDSFLAEARWKRAIEMQESDPFAVEPVLTACSGVVRSVTPFRFAPIAVETVAADEALRAAYAEEKERLFANEKSVTAIIGKLAALVQERIPQRSVPSPSRLFRQPPKRIVRSDLTVDEFLTSQLMNAVRLTNAVADFRQ